MSLHKKNNSNKTFSLLELLLVHKNEINHLNILYMIEPITSRLVEKFTWDVKPVCRLVMKIVCS